MRLALGLVLLLCAGSWLTMEWVKRELRQDIDTQLRAMATNAAELLDGMSIESVELLGGFVDGSEIAFDSEEWAVVVRAPDGRTAAVGPGTRDAEQVPDVLDTPIAELRGRAGELFTLDDVGGGDDAYRAISVALRNGGVAVLASSQDDVNAVTRILHKTFFVGTFVIVLALGLLVWIVSRHVLKPLDDVVETAHKIGAGNLDTRVGVDSTAPDLVRLRDALNTMLDRLQASFARQERTEARLRQFVSNASHELRTPLAAILGHAELYHEGMARSPDDVDRAMRHITAEGTRMQSLVEDLLLLARLDEGRPLARDSVDLTAVVDEAVAAIATLDGDHPVIVDVEPVEVVGDGQALRQILDNLLMNVVVHTPPGTTVRVRLESLGELGGGIGGARLVVSDDGPGMPPEIAGSVFERFVRGERSRARPDGSLGGSGLGLSIVDELVRAHGGTIALETAPGAGATFTVMVPARSGQDAHARSGPDAHARSGQDAHARSGQDSLRHELSSPVTSPARGPHL